MPNSLNQRGFVSPVLIIIGSVVVLAIIFFVATGSFKFDASIDKPAQVSQDQSAAEEPKTFEKEGVSFNYPGDWQFQDSGAGLGGFLSPKEGSNDIFQENVIVHKVDVSVKPDITLKEVVDSVIRENEEDFASSGSFELVDRSSVSLGGIEAEKVTYLASDANITSGKAMSVVALKDNFAYVINYTAEEKSFDKFLDGVELIISSFQVQ